MINVAEITSTKGVEQAQKQIEQAKNRMALEKKKANEERRTFENHHKYMMGGAVHKYFKDCFSFEESEINEILEVAFKTAEVKKTISDIRRSKANALEKKGIRTERGDYNRKVLEIRGLIEFIAKTSASIEAFVIFSDTLISEPLQSILLIHVQ